MLSLGNFGVLLWINLACFLWGIWGFALDKFGLLSLGKRGLLSLGKHDLLSVAFCGEMWLSVEKCGAFPGGM